MITVPILQQPIPVPAQTQLPVESIRADNQQVPPVPQPAQLFQAKANRTVSADKANTSLAEANTGQSTGAATGSANAVIGDSAHSGDGDQSPAEDNNAKQKSSEQQQTTASNKATEARQQQQVQQQISQLASRDREVRAHESAHAAVGGQFTGAPQFSFQKGPDGVLYAVSGEVSISTSEVPGDPVATLAKLETVIRAALAPAEPSSQDIRVASSAAASAARIRSELALSKREDPPSATSDNTTSDSVVQVAKVSIKSISQILEDKLKNTGALLSNRTNSNPFTVNA